MSEKKIRISIEITRKRGEKNSGREMNLNWFVSGRLQRSERSERPGRHLLDMRIRGEGDKIIGLQCHAVRYRCDCESNSFARCLDLSC